MHLKWKPISSLCSRPWHFPRAKPWAPVMAWEALHDTARVPEAHLRLRLPVVHPRPGLLTAWASLLHSKLNAFYPRAPWLKCSALMTTGIHFTTLHLLHSAISMRAMLRVLPHDPHPCPTAPLPPHRFSFSMSCVAFYNPVCSCMRFLIVSLPVLELGLWEDWNLCLSCSLLCSKSRLGSHTNQA